MNNLIDLTPIVAAVISVCAVAITVKVIPWIKSKTSKEDLEKAAAWTQVAVKAAEQLVERGAINKDAKFAYVETFLMKKGFKLDLQEIEALIEGYVYDLSNKLVPEEVSITETPAVADTPEEILPEVK